MPDRVARKLADSWRKNKYEIKGILGGGMPAFIFSPRPAELADCIAVFGYHTVSTAHLEGDLEFLRRNDYTTLSGNEFLQSLHGERPIGAREVLLTFDDGPVNFYSAAFPALRRYDAHAICFVAPGMHQEEVAPQFRGLAERPMSWGELREIHASGLVDIESHTLESRYIPAWPRPQALLGVDAALEDSLRNEPLPMEEDFRRAKALLESQLPGKTVRHLAFPCYDGTPEAVDAAVRCGYEACYWGVTPLQPVNTRRTSPLRVSRVSYEYLRRLPGTGRCTLRDVVDHRLRIVRGVQWQP